MRNAGAVVAALRAGAQANREARCRRGSIDVVEVRAEDAGTPAGTLIATGDLHDSPLHLARVVRAAGMDVPGTATLRVATNPSERHAERGGTPCHLTLHELIHGERLVNGMDYSYRVLVRAASLKAAFPERVHVLLANHEIAQMIGSPVMKDGVKCNEAFDEALEATFGDEADLAEVKGAIRAFIRSMALALRVKRPGLPDMLCSHALPAPGLMDRFDPDVLGRELTDDDFLPRTGSAYLMTWGRGWTNEHFDALGQRWNVGLFILGHEKAETGCTVVAPGAVVLNSDHARGVYARVDVVRAATAADIAGACVALAAE